MRTLLFTLLLLFALSAKSQPCIHCSLEYMQRSFGDRNWTSYKEDGTTYYTHQFKDFTWTYEMDAYHKGQSLNTIGVPLNAKAADEFRTYLNYYWTITDDGWEWITRDCIIGCVEIDKETWVNSIDRDLPVFRIYIIKEF